MPVLMLQCDGLGVFEFQFFLSFFFPKGWEILMTFHMRKCFSAKLKYRDYQIVVVVVVVVIIITIIFFDTIITLRMK